MKLGLRSNVDQVMKDIDSFVHNAEVIAMPRALNKLRDQAQTAGLRRVADVYKLGPRTTEKYLRITLATAATLEASIIATGRGFPLSEFKPIQTKAGVSVQIKGRRILIPHAFMSKRFGLHVFARGGYQGKTSGVRPTGQRFGRFIFGKGRTPIGEFFTFGPAEVFANPEIVEAMQDRIEEQAASVVRQEISAARRGF